MFDLFPLWFDCVELNAEFLTFTQSNQTQHSFNDDDDDEGTKGLPLRM